MFKYVCWIVIFCAVAFSSKHVGAIEYDKEKAQDSLVWDGEDMCVLEMLDAEENRLPEPREIRVECLKTQLLIEINRRTIRYQESLAELKYHMDNAKTTDEFYRFFYEYTCMEKRYDYLLFLKAQLE